MSIDNTDDVIDSRDVIARIEKLEAERAAFNEARANPTDGEWHEEFSEDYAELTALSALADEASGYAADWVYGETLIRDSAFKDYAMQLADDLGMDLSQSWPLNCIDWDLAARELQMDYTPVDFDGVTYWVR